MKISSLFFFCATLSFSLSSLTAQGLQKIFDPATVTEIIWKTAGKVLTLKKEHDAKNQKDIWKKRDSAGSNFGSFIPDEWNIHRLLILLSALENPQDIKSEQMKGRITFVTDKNKFEGVYSDQGFVWTSGEAAGKGFKFETDPDRKGLFDEGILGLSLHELKICEPKKITKVEFVSEKWSLAKNKNKWVLQINSDSSLLPARPIPVEQLLSQLCDFKVDHFGPSVDLASLSKEAKASPILILTEGKKQKQLLNFKDNFVFETPMAFSSRALAELLKTNPDLVKDSALDEGKIALDSSKPQQDRLTAIRKMKDDHSPEAVASLELLVNEKTELDLYRYEAVDALAAIGTKEAFKVIANRLAEIGRSGFELRLARALSMAMGRTFMSDEKTPEPQRRAEVQDLLEAYRKKPAGR